MSSPGLRDDPFSPENTFERTLDPNDAADCCGYEKEVIRKFMNFSPNPVPYFPSGPNSNTFAFWLIDSDMYNIDIMPEEVPNAPGIDMPMPWR